MNAYEKSLEDALWMKANAVQDSRGEGASGFYDPTQHVYDPNAPTTKAEYQSLLGSIDAFNKGTLTADDPNAAKIMGLLNYDTQFADTGKIDPAVLDSIYAQRAQDSKDSVLDKVMSVALPAVGAYMTGQALTAPGAFDGFTGGGMTGDQVSAALDNAGVPVTSDVPAVATDGPIGGMNANPGTLAQQTAETAAREGSIDSNMLSNYDGPIGGYNANPGTAAQQASETLARETAVDGGLGTAATPSILDKLTTPAAVSALTPALLKTIAALTQDQPATGGGTPALGGSGGSGAGSAGSTGAQVQTQKNALAAALLGVPQIAQVAMPVINHEATSSAMPVMSNVSNLDTMDQAGSTWNQALAAQLRGR